MSEAIEESGYFWLPDNPGSRLPGTLRISETGESSLEIIGSFSDPLDVNALKNPEPLKRVVGLIRNDMVTLENCYYKKRDISFGGISKTIIGARFAFKGVGYESSDSISFSKLEFSVEGLDEWLSITGLRVDYDWENKGATIKYIPPKEIPIQLPDGIDLKFTFSWTLPGAPVVTEAKITQKAIVSLTSQSLRKLEDFLALASKITNFLCFAIDETVSLVSATGYSHEIKRENGEGQTREKPIRIYFQDIRSSDVKAKVESHRMLFHYGHIAKDLERILNNWLANYTTSEPAFNLYFTAKAGAQKYIDGRFLSLAQGIETLHRRNSTKTLMPENEFKQMLQIISKNCPGEKKHWLNDRIAYGNELSLRQRLTEMLEPFQNLYGTETERRAFIGKVVDTRNYLTHYDERLSNKATTGIEFWQLCMKLEVLFQLHFLRLMGLTNDTINTLVNDNHSIKWKLEQ